MPTFNFKSGDHIDNMLTKWLGETGVILLHKNAHPINFEYMPHMGVVTMCGELKSNNNFHIGRTLAFSSKSS